MVGATFDKLMQLLGPDREQSGLAYRQLHDRLTRYFDWNGGEDPQALADETLDRIGNRLEKSEAVEPIQNISAFALGIARNLLREDLRKRKRATETGTQWNSLSEGATTEEKEILDKALGHSLMQLPVERRKLIEAYYMYERDKALSHRKLATRYGISINALRTRALRVRQELEAAIAHYLEDNRQ